MWGVSGQSALVSTLEKRDGSITKLEGLHRRW